MLDIDRAQIVGVVRARRCMPRPVVATSCRGEDENDIGDID
jgi:hypothetical protein